MRSHYTRQIIQNPYKVSPFQQRSRLKSLKQLRNIPYEDPIGQNQKNQQHILKLLQRKLVQQSIKQQKQQISYQNLNVNLNQSNQKNNIKSKRLSELAQSKQVKKQQSQKKLLLLKQSNKLFIFFQQQYKKQIPQDKVQRQKVNFWEKQFNQIKSKVNHKLYLNYEKIQQLQKKLSKNYINLHEYSSELKQLTKQVKQQQKIQLLNQNKKKSKGSNQFFNSNNSQKIEQNLSNSSNLSTFKLKPPSLKQKYSVIEQTIVQLKKQIYILQQQIQTIKQKRIQIQQQWTSFLKLFINYGYYLINGLDSIMEQMKKFKIKFIENDILSQIFDQNSKKYLLTYYQNYHIKKGSKDNNNVDENDQFQNVKNNGLGQRKKFKSDFQMKTLADRNNLKDIYSNTRQAMNNLVKKSSFKASPQLDKIHKKQLYLPKIQPRKNNPSAVDKYRPSQDKNKNKDKDILRKSKTVAISFGDQKQRQINRINHIYFNTQDEQMNKKGKLIKRMLFGFSIK